MKPNAFIIIDDRVVVSELEIAWRTHLNPGIVVIDDIVMDDHVLRVIVEIDANTCVVPLAVVDPVVVDFSVRKFRAPGVD
ncbi:hypothetical protein D3C71_1622480 [compost metagenome]